MIKNRGSSPSQNHPNSQITSELWQARTTIEITRMRGELLAKDRRTMQTAKTLRIREIYKYKYALVTNVFP